MKKVIIYGAGAYAQLFYCNAAKEGVIDVVAFTVDQDYIKEKSLYGLPIIPFENVALVYPPEEYDMIVLCGYNRMRNRTIMYNKAKEKGYTLINYISPKAIIETEIEMGDNNIIMANSTVGYGGKMGSGNVIRQNVYLGHEFVMHNHSIISCGCNLGGRATIEDMVFIGIGVSAKGYITYGKESLIGVGSVVVKDIEPYSINYGNPAKPHGYNRQDGVIVIEGKDKI